MIILVDQDGVLADFEAGFQRAWRARRPDGPPVRTDRTTWDLMAGLPPELHAEAWAAMHAPGFFLGLDPLPGAVEAVRELASRHDVLVCTTPLHNAHAAQEKLAWVERHLGREFLPRVITTHDKTLVHGDLLIDDRPEVTGRVARPAWEHVVYDQPYNAHVTNRRRMTWASWRSIVA